jgi:hypothetical protein
MPHHVNSSVHKSAQLTLVIFVRREDVMNAIRRAISLLHAISTDDKLAGTLVEAVNRDLEVEL